MKARFRAANVLVRTYSLKYGSESLHVLDFEMQPCVGHPSGDPALPDSWKQFWGAAELRTPREAALIAADFIDAEGERADDGQHRRLANELRTPATEPADDWQSYLHMARDYANPGAWKFSD